MQPKLKGDTVFIPVPDGIYSRNNQSSLKMKGKVICRWVESLAPYLTRGLLGMCLAATSGKPGYCYIVHVLVARTASPEEVTSR